MNTKNTKKDMNIKTDNTLLEKIIEIQKEAVKSWTQNNMLGTVVMATGHGKNAVALMCIQEILSNNCNPKILFVAETVQRETNVRKDFEKLGKLYGWVVPEFEFMTYQKAYKTKGSYDLLILDEVHFCMTPVYHNIFKSINSNCILGLTATPEVKIKYELDSKNLTKNDYYKKYLPIIYTYTAKNAKENGTYKKSKVIVYNLELSKENNIRFKNSKWDFMTSEASTYVYLQNQLNKSFYKTKPVVQRCMYQRNKFLGNFETKVNTAESIIKYLQSIKKRFIVFNTELEILDKLLPNRVVKSKMKKDENESIIEDFNMGKVDEIGSFRILSQGVNLNDLDAIFIMGYYSSYEKMDQIVGRLRPLVNKDTYIIIFKTKNTVEEQWFEKATESLRYKTNEIDDNYIIINNLDQLENIISNK